MQICRRGKGLKRAGSVLAALLALVLSAQTVSAYNAGKAEKYGLIRGDLSTWTQRGSSFSENRQVSVNGYSALSSMGCSYYATFFMLCRMGLRNPLTDTAWELALECREKGLCRDGTGYFDPRSIAKVTDGRAVFVEEGNYGNYYSGQRGIERCENHEDVTKLLRRLMEEKGYFCVACVVGTVTNYQGLEYNSAGHYIFIDSLLSDDWLIGDPAFPGTRWSDNWGQHGGEVVKIYAYQLLDENGDQVWPSERQSMYVVRSFDEY
jgi:hypothetical protein